MRFPYSSLIPIPSSSFPNPTRYREVHKELAVEMEGLRYAGKAAQAREKKASSLLSEASTLVGDQEERIFAHQLLPLTLLPM